MTTEKGDYFLLLFHYSKLMLRANNLNKKYFKMIKLKDNNGGFSVIEILLIVLTLAVIGGAGYVVSKHLDAKNSAAKVVAINTATPKETLTNPYEGWKTATLQYEKITYQYPSSWTVSDQSAPVARHDVVTLSAPNGFSFSINDGIQNGGDPLPLVSSDPMIVKYLGSPAYLVFVNPKVAQANGPSVPDTSTVGSAILLTNASNQASFPADKNVIGNSQYNGVNGPEGSYTFITMGYDTINNIPIATAKADSEYNNGKLVIQSMKY
jgi:hypothetical protein